MIESANVSSSSYFECNPLFELMENSLMDHPRSTVEETRRCPDGVLESYFSVHSFQDTRKIKGAYTYRSVVTVGVVFTLFLVVWLAFWAFLWICITTKSVTHGQCMRRQASVTFLTSERHRPSTSTIKLYSFWWQRQVCVSGLLRTTLDSAVDESRTRDLSITSPTLYHETADLS